MGEVQVLGKRCHLKNQEPRTKNQEQFIGDVRRIIDQSLTVRQIEKFLDRVDMSPDAKALLSDLMRVTIKVGTTVLQIGRQILTFIIDLVARFPNTTFGVIVGVVLTMLVAAVPLIGGVLAGVIGPLLIAFGIGMGAINDMRDASLRGKVAEFATKLNTINKEA